MYVNINIKTYHFISNNNNNNKLLFSVIYSLANIHVLTNKYTLLQENGIP